MCLAYMKGKVKDIIVGTVLAASIATGGYVGTGGGFEALEGSWMTKRQYNALRKELRVKMASEQITPLELLYVDTPEMRKYRAIINKKKKTIERKINKINKTNLIQSIVDEATK